VGYFSQPTVRLVPTAYVTHQVIIIIIIIIINEEIIMAFSNKNSSGDEIANVNFFTTISHTYFKTLKREPISFNKLDDS